MRKYKIPLFLTKKAVDAVITIFLVMSILFFLMNSMPGGDMVTRTCPFCGEEVKTALRELWGLDRPLYEQYLIYMKKVFTMDYRLVPDQTITSMDELLYYLPYTLLLFGTAAILSYVIGVFLGIRLLSRGGNWLKTAISGISVVFYAIPAFVFAMFFRNWFIFKYQIFPPVNIQLGGPELVEGSIFLEHLTNIQELLPAMALPLIILVMVGLARPLLLLKDHMALLLDEPFVMTAKAKGLSENAMLSNHVARCALLPLMSDASINLCYIVSGGILIEYIFKWPGIGTELFGSLKVMDYPGISAAIFLLTVILLVSMAIVDALNASLDPRVSV
ncbi:MAG: ABC transporter permease [Theionarchaea archaeon]|nr:ABC transporter permease [Theionarchaea archaeon]